MAIVRRVLLSTFFGALVLVLTLFAGGCSLLPRAQDTGAEKRLRSKHSPQQGFSDAVGPSERNGQPASLTGVAEGAVSVGDVSGDGRPDLFITGNARSTRSRPSTTLYVNDGDGSFTDTEAGLPNVQGSATALGRVDGDDDLDLLVTGDGTRGRVAELYLGGDNADFTPSGANFAAVSGGAVASGDVNGDDDLDFLITGRTLSGGSATPTATLYLGSGDGGFTRARAGLAGVAKSASALGDVNRDGHLDLLITGIDTAGVPTTTLYLGNGYGDFTEANANLPGLSRGAAALHDLDGDGHLDVLISGLNEEEEPSTHLYLGDGTGAFTEASVKLPDVGNGTVSIGDVDGDNYADVLITGEEETGTSIATLYLGDEGARFSAARVDLSGVSRSATAIADVDGDGHLDLLITGEGDRGKPTATLYRGDGDGGFLK